MIGMYGLRLFWWMAGEGLFAVVGGFVLGRYSAREGKP